MKTSAISDVLLQDYGMSADFAFSTDADHDGCVTAAGDVLWDGFFICAGRDVDEKPSGSIELLSGVDSVLEDLGDGQMTQSLDFFDKEGGAGDDLLPSIFQLFGCSGDDVGLPVPEESCFQLCEIFCCRIDGRIFEEVDGQTDTDEFISCLGVFLEEKDFRGKANGLLDLDQHPVIMVDQEVVFRF